VIARDPVSFTAVPPGEGIRSGIDRDEDGRLDAGSHGIDRSTQSRLGSR